MTSDRHFVQKYPVFQLPLTSNHNTVFETWTSYIVKKDLAERLEKDVMTKQI